MYRVIIGGFLLLQMQLGIAQVRYEVGDRQIINELADQLYTICAPEGKFLYNTIVKIKDGNSRLEFNCNAHLLALVDMAKEMHQKESSYDDFALNCVSSMDEYLPQVAIPAIDVSTTLCRKHSGVDCSAAFVCAMVTGPFNHLVKKIHLSSTRMNSVLQECGDMKVYQCLGSALRGVWDNLAISGQAIWKLLGMAKDGIVWTGKTLYNKTIGSLIRYFSDVEEVTSDQMLVASSMEPSIWEQFKKNPVKVSKELAKGFYNVLTAGIKDHYGCEQWSGKPFISKCLVPMRNWDCASCTQKMNSICGVLGFAGGELVVAYLTGGATVVTKKLVQYGMRGGSKLVQKVLLPVKAYRWSVKSRRASIVLETTADVTKNVAETTVRVGMRMKLRDLLSIAGRVSFKVGKRVANAKVFKVVTTTSKKILTPVRKYIELTDWAFMKGYRQTGTVLRSMEAQYPGVITKFIAKSSKSAPQFLKFVTDKDIGINVKTYGSYVASFDRGKRGREQSKKNQQSAMSSDKN